MTGILSAFWPYLPFFRRLGSRNGADIRETKHVLAYEATKLCHGEAEAKKARDAASQLFGGNKSEFSESVPSYAINSEELERGLMAYLLFEKTGLCKTRGEARRLISQGGGYVNDRRIEAFDQVIDLKDMMNDSILELSCEIHSPTRSSIRNGKNKKDTFKTKETKERHEGTCDGPPSRSQPYGSS